MLHQTEEGFIDSSFSPGQRWVSNAEPELGLGLVETRSEREVTLQFPAIGEQRTYSIHNAPLTRVTYAVGDRIRHQSGFSLLVIDRELHAGQMFYQAAIEGSEPVIVPERDLDSFFQLRKANDRLLTGQLDRNRLFELRTESLLHHHRHHASPVLGLLGARAQLLPHQLYIASEVAKRHAPRVLLADEVGLGKTIEAGLIMHQLLISGRARRVLIAVPETLVHQWLVEMLRRFNLLFTVMDEERFEALGEDGSNPFEAAQLVLTTLPLLVDPAMQAAALEAGFDLLIVDEAHHLTWSEDGASEEFELVVELAGAVPGVLLLTGTPEQLGVEGHFARLRILDPARYHDLDTFLAEEAGFETVSDLIELLAEPLTLIDDEVAAQVELHLGDDWGDALLATADDPEASVRAQVIDQLLDRHGTGRVLFRNVRESVGGFPARQLQSHPLPAPDPYVSGAQDASVIALLRPENLLGEDWLRHDPRVAWLEQWLVAHRADRALLICASATTARMLEEHLRTRCAVRSGVFHEGMSLLARDRAAAYFAQTEEPAQILVCSEIGSEGRNFQFASHLILFDLPLNPDLLEQRIGRLDRIGQMNTIAIHVPYYEDTAMARLLQWYHDALNAFEVSSPVASRVLEDVRDSLLGVLRQSDAADEAALMERSRELHADALAVHQRGRNRLLDMNSCRPHRADEIVANVTSAAREAELFAFMQRVFDAFGIEHEQNTDESVVLRPGEHMLADNFPSLPEDGAKATFRRHHALQREDLLFLTWEHPMVSGAMDLLLGTELGSAALCTIKLPPLPPSSLLLECIFVLRTQAPPDLQVQRFITGPAVRLLLDEQGRDLGARITRTRLNGIARGVPTAMAQDVIKHARQRIESLLKHAEGIAAERSLPLVRAAVAKVEEVQTAELERLAALAECNPNIREEELHAVVHQTEALIDHMERVELELDAVRLVVAT
ncbi:MAG: RNA polymerase-associated protein RapA [Pseudomonadota bacterium]